MKEKKRKDFKEKKEEVMTFKFVEGEEWKANRRRMRKARKRGKSRIDEEEKKRKRGRKIK